MASALSMSATVMGKFQSRLPFTMLLNFVLEGNPIAHFRILAALATDLAQPKMSHTLSFSGMYQKSFIHRSNRNNSQ